MDANGNLSVALDNHKFQREEYVRIRHELNIDVLHEGEAVPEALRIPTRMDRLQKIKTLSNVPEG